MTFPVQTFRQFAHRIRQPRPYFPIITELKGITNLVLGLIELFISLCIIAKILREIVFQQVIGKWAVTLVRWGLCSLHLDSCLV